ncbi:hypothetical protein I6A82_12490 [Novosphingopyxis sp. YJ-S2-01]|nr:hypothetical protein [Novosphingopyxis sp. YJ-S2-01]
MSKIPYTSRRKGRYYFRRKARWQNVGDYVAVIPLATCSAKDARLRSNSMVGRFEELKGVVTTMIEAGTVINQEQTQQLFDNELRLTLDRFVRPPWPRPMDDLRLVEPIDGLGQSVIITVADTAD